MYNPLKLFNLQTLPVFLLLLFATGCTQISNSNLIAAPKEENPYERLINGNDRFSHLNSTHPHESLQRLKELSEEQHPFAVVVCCSDSRVSPELIFDQGMGDLFVIRTVGNIIGSIEMGSIEYAVEHLGVKVLHGIKQLHTQSNILAEKIEKKELAIIGVRYDLDDFKILL